MVLCRQCANVVGATTLRCSRCGLSLPYYRSRRWRPRLERPVLYAAGRECPRCGRATVRQRSPLWLRPVRAATPNRSSYRECKVCGWKGAAFHDAGDPDRAS